MDFHRFMVPRLEGNRLGQRFERYLGLVKKGIAGFIVFGGELEELRRALSELQSASALPLIISSDLEQGLGQHVRGGTLMPPAMAMASAGDLALARAAYRQVAEEAAYAGINVIFAPVLDVNSNPLNPIIATRAFGQDVATVIAYGEAMIKEFEAAGIKSCAKHFPGHGDTSLDSHLVLPTLDKSISELEACELLPFRASIRAGTSLVMLGHLRVPALDPTGTPAAISSAVVRYLRETMGFSGIITTDAMDMGALKALGEALASRMALEAGVDILLHPSDAEGLAEELGDMGILATSERLDRFRRTLISTPSNLRPSFDPALSQEITRRAIRVEGPSQRLKDPVLLVLSDDEETVGRVLIDELGLRHYNITKDTPLPEEITKGAGQCLAAVFSRTRAWKGGSASWLREALLKLNGLECKVALSFGSPYLIKDTLRDATKIYAYWASEAAEREAALALKGLLKN